MKLHLLATTLAVILVAGSGAVVAQNTSTEKGKISYALGYKAGLEIAGVLKSGEQLDLPTVMKAFQDATTLKNPAIAPEQLSASLQVLKSRMVAKTKSEMDLLAANNKTKSDIFLALNKGKPGVQVLFSGVQYRVIEAGNGAKPTLANQISVEYKATLPDGVVIADTSLASYGQPAGPVTIRLSEIPLSGLREALQMMPAGARWEVVLPGSAAYGTNAERAGEMANQAVIFNIKLKSVGPIMPAPKR
jgi:peptidylprolyl isomerase